MEFVLILENTKKILRVVVRAFFFRGSRNLQARLNLTGTVVLVTPLQLEDTHRVVTIDENVSTVCDVSAGRNSRKFQTKKPVHQQVKKRLMLHATKNSFDCVSLHFILKPWKSGSTGKQDRVETALESLRSLAERLKIQPFTDDSCIGGSFQVQLLVP